MKQFKVVFQLMILASSLLFQSCNSEKKAPNVVFFLIDDLGWNDLACYGSNFHETPNLDQLAAQGMLFTDAYAACSVCSPTRASILTGKYPARLNITDWIPGSDPQNRPLLGTKDKHELPLSEQTIAETLHEAGYATSFIGKWHLGEKGYFPEDQGFDINIGGHWAGQPASYFYPYKNKRKRWDVPGLEGGEEGEYLTDRLAMEAQNFIKENQNNPFFLYLAHYSVHTPIQAKEALKKKYSDKLSASDTLPGPAFTAERESQVRQKQNNPAYAAMVQSIDESVGGIMKLLEELNLAENTIIIFTSDNGGLSTLPRPSAPTSVKPLRAGKGWLYEGGIRVPLIIKWPGKIKAGSKSDAIVTSTDFYPSILEMLDLPLLPQQHPDGKSLAAHLTQNKEWERESIFWHFPHYHGSGNRPSAAMRKGDYKILYWYEDQSMELYNLKEDLSEQNNLAEQEREKATQLKKELEDWQKSVGALYPRVNKNSDKK